MDRRPARFVYILRSDREPKRHYTGLTSDVPERLKWHNAGLNVHTARHRPWSLVVAVEFTSEAEAPRFERYLKSGSGRAFAKRYVALGRTLFWLGLATAWHTNSELARACLVYAVASAIVTVGLTMPPLLNVPLWQADPTMPGSVAAWTPNVVFVLIGCALLVRAHHSAKFDGPGAIG